jgi:hypothetical protein
MTLNNVYQLVSPATMYRNRFALKAVFDYAWRGSHELEVDKTTGFFYMRRKGVSNIGLPIIEEKAKHKVQQLFSAFDAACAKHKELQKTGVKELFSNMRFINSVAEADDSITGIANIRMYFKPYLKVNEKDGEAPVMESEVTIEVGKDYQIRAVSYSWLPIKESIRNPMLPRIKQLTEFDFVFRKSSNNLITPYYAY